MTNGTAWGITVLYGLGGFLPIIGIWLAGARIWKPAGAYLARQKHVEQLRRTYQEREKSITTQPERDVLDAWMTAELSKTDKLGIPYDYSDAVLFGYSPLAHQASQFRDLRRDVIFVGLGVVSATAASIWSIWGGTPPV